MEPVEREQYGQYYAVEAIELALHPPEHYEHGMCVECFEKSLHEEESE